MSWSSWAGSAAARALGPDSDGDLSAKGSHAGPCESGRDGRDALARGADLGEKQPSLKRNVNEKSWDMVSYYMMK